MRVVRGYVARQLQAESVEVARDRESISRLASETASMKAELHKLKTKVWRWTACLVVVQFTVGFCWVCGV